MKRDLNIAQEELESLEQYIFKQMSDDENEAFTKKLNLNLALQHKLHAIQLLMVGIQEAELEKRLDEFHNDLTSIKKNSFQFSLNTFSQKKWWVAASVLLIIALGIWFAYNRDTKEEKLFASYFHPEAGLISAMSSSDNYLFDRAMVDYKMGEYDAALKNWENLLASKPGNDTLNYFIGSAWLMKGEEENAIIHFEKVIANQNSTFRNDALWYTGLALLKTKRKTEAVDFIERAEHENSAALLRELRNSE